VAGFAEYSVPWPPGEVAAFPAERKSATAGSSRARRRRYQANLQSFIMSNSVVTPNVSAWRRCSANCACVCASMKPGSSVRPSPSMISVPFGISPSAIFPFRTRTVARSSTFSPSNTRTFWNTMGRGADAYAYSPAALLIATAMPISQRRQRNRDLRISTRHRR
jgi:hypothetical protein